MFNADSVINQEYGQLIFEFCVEFMRDNAWIFYRQWFFEQNLSLASHLEYIRSILALINKI